MATVIECCKGCVAPVRYPGCHDHCPLYMEEKEAYEARKAEVDRKRFAANNIQDQRGKAVRRALKGRRTKYG